MIKTKSDQEEFIMSEKIYTKNAPDAIGPYSQAVKSGNLLLPRVR